MAHFNKEKALETIKSGDMDDIQALLDDLEERLNEKKYGLIWEHGGEDEDSAFEPEYVVLDYQRNVPYPKLRADLSTSPERAHGNMLLEGDNYIWLKMLEQTHAGTVDVIAIDPPYGTGKKDFKYNDTFVDANDTYKHSKWLDFMTKRLQLSRKLLKETGVIIINIDEHKSAPLHMLLEEIFGADNFLGDIIWNKKNPKGDAGGIACQHETIIVFAKNKPEFLELPNACKRAKPHAQIMIDKAAQLFAQKDKKGLDAINAEFKKWLNKQPFSNGEKAYNVIDENGEIYQAVSMAWPNKKKAPDEYFIPLIHPITGKPCPVPGRGWRNPPATMAKLLERNRILFGNDETTQPRRKYVLSENMYENTPSIYENGESTDKYFDDIGVSFSYAKPTSEVEYCLLSVHPNPKVILDFFAGSGTTAEAVERLNQQDGGHRQWILITNNEDQEEDDGNPETGICRDTTKPRIDTVISGLLSDGTRYGDGTNSGYQYFQYDFMPRYESREANQRAFFTPTKNVDAIVRIKYGVVLKELDRARMAMTYESDDKQVIVFIKDVDEDLMEEFFDDEHEQHIVLANDIVDVDGVESDTIHSLIPSYEFFM